VVWYDPTPETVWMQRRQKLFKIQLFTKLKKITGRIYSNCSKFSSLFFQSFKYRCCSFCFINWFSESNFKTVLFQRAWFNWCYDVSLVSRFVFCANTVAHLCLPNVLRFELSHWQFRRIDHNGSHKPVSVLSPSSCTYNSHIKNENFLAYFMRILNYCVVYKF